MGILMNMSQICILFNRNIIFQDPFQLYSFLLLKNIILPFN